MVDVMREVSAFPDGLPKIRRPIIVAVGEGGGVSALRMARAIAARDASDIVVISVVEPPPSHAFEPLRALQAPGTIEQQLMERRKSVNARLHGLGWSAEAQGESAVEMRYGDTASETADLARELRAGFIVMGIGPHAIGRRLLATGTAWATSRRAPCPVLAVSERAHDRPRIAVVGTDFSPESIHAVLPPRVGPREPEPDAGDTGAGLVTGAVTPAGGEAGTGLSDALGSGLSEVAGEAEPGAEGAGAALRDEGSVRHTRSPAAVASARVAATGNQTAAPRNRGRVVSGVGGATTGGTLPRTNVASRVRHSSHSLKWPTQTLRSTSDKRPSRNMDSTPRFG